MHTLHSKSCVFDEMKKRRPVSKHARMPSEDMIRMGTLYAFRMSSQHQCKYLASTALVALQHYHSQLHASTMLSSTLHDVISQHSCVATDWFVNFIGNPQCNA